MSAKNAKLVLLTGTPIVNYPNEIAYMLNLVKGQTKVYELPYTGKTAYEHMLANEPSIDYYMLKKNGNRKSIHIVLAPQHFRRLENGKLQYVEEGDDTDDTKMKRIVDNLKKAGVQLKTDSDKLPSEQYKLLPTTSEEFNDLFIDMERKTTKNDDLFRRRIQGLVSYYESSNRALYPENLGTTEELLYFSDHQFNKYATMRDQEIKKEQKAKKHMSKNEDEFQKSGVFKTFSRILCNFAFPDDIDRPFPTNNMALMAGEIDDFDNEFQGDKSSALPEKKSALYQEKVKKALAFIKKHKDKYFNTTSLAEYSPKYARIIEHINAIDGSALVYSQFRSVEGLGLLAIALEAMGYAEMKVSVDNKKITIDVKEEDYLKPKYAMFSTDKEVSNVLLKIFNSDLSSFDSDVRETLKKMDVSGKGEANLRGSLIKVMMITQSGSAGISLKNVRQVHVLEPYWNKSRIDQVIGRANRTCSHIDLPPEDRNFRVYMYRMRLTEKQKSRSMYIKSQDDGKSTDETIFNLAKRKDEVISELLKRVKEGAVDCSIHKKNNIGFSCFAFPQDVGDFEIAYYANLKEDDEDEISKQRVTQVKTTPIKVTINNKSFIWIKTTNELYDLNLYSKSGVLDKVGLLENLNNGWYKLTVKKNKQ